MNPYQQGGTTPQGAGFTQNSKQDIQKTLTMLVQRGELAITAKADKTPAVKGWQRRQPPLSDMLRQLGTGYASMIGLVCTKGIECIDIDVKHDPTGTIATRWRQKVEENGGGKILRKCIIQRTPSQGFHVVYRYAPRNADRSGNQKLARSANKQTLIETRGKGGYFVVSPSKGYELLKGSFRNIPIISKDERDFLLEMARALDETPEPTYNHQGRILDPPHPRPSRGGLVDTFGAYCRHVHPIDILKRHGWTITAESSDRIFVKRPGSKAKYSGNIKTVNGCPVLICWSSSTSLPTERGLNAVDILAHLEFGGDKRAVSNFLFSEGYGRKEGKL